MYINYNKIIRDGYDIDVVYLLHLISFCSIKKNDPENYWSRYINVKYSNILFDIEGFYTTSSSGRHSLNKSGKSLLDKYTTVDKADSDEGDEVIFNYLVNFVEYNSGEFFIANKSQLMRDIISFRTHTGLESKAIFTYIVRYFSDEAPKYLRKIENLFYKPKNAFSKKFNLDDSLLYDYIKQQNDNF